MIISRPRVVGLLILVAVSAAGCRATADEPEVRPAGVAVPSYAAVPGAPEHCALLADSRHLTEIPPAVGLLAGERGNVEAELALGAAIDELRTARDAVRERGQSPALEGALGDLVTALTRARDTTMTTALRDSISTGLDDVGRLAQPDCGFPS